VEDRKAFLERTCAGDAELRRKVEALLDSDQRAGSFIESPAIDEAPELIEERMKEKP